MSCGVKVCIVLLEVFVFVSYFFALTSFSVVAAVAAVAVAAVYYYYCYCSEYCDDTDKDSKAVKKLDCHNIYCTDIVTILQLVKFYSVL